MWMSDGKSRSEAEDKDVQGSCDLLSAIVTGHANPLELDKSSNQC